MNSQYVRLYFPGVLIGPYLEYAMYSSLIEGTLFDITVVARHTVVTDDRFPKQSLSYRFVWFVFHPPYHVYPNMTATFVRYAHRILIAGFVEHSKYYGVWILTEGASIDLLAMGRRVPPPGTARQRSTCGRSRFRKALFPCPDKSP